MLGTEPNGEDTVDQPEYLDELVRIDSENIQFPEKCPVCGRPTNAYGSVFASKGVRVKVTTGHGAKVRKDRWVLEVPVCERHANSVSLVRRVGAPLIALGGIVCLSLIYSSTAIVMSVLDHRSIGPGWGTLFIATLIGTLLLLLVLGPTKLQRTVMVLSVDSATRSIVLRIKNPEWRRELIGLNGTAVRPRGISRSA